MFAVVMLLLKLFKKKNILVLEKNIVQEPVLKSRYPFGTGIEKTPL